MEAGWAIQKGAVFSVVWLLLSTFGARDTFCANCTIFICPAQVSDSVRSDPHTFHLSTGCQGGLESHLEREVTEH